MLSKTQGIVINYVKYKESSIIVKIYTKEFGIQSYIENGVRSARAKNKIALFQPLTLLDLVIYHKKGKDIHRIAEIKCNHPFETIPYEIAKSSVAIFVTEILTKTLREETPNEQLFDFVEESILWLDGANKHFECFHIQFLLAMTAYLGFLPETVEEMEEELSLYGYPLTKGAKAGLQLLWGLEYGDAPRIDRHSRNEMVEILLHWYKIHLETFGEIKSLAVLKEILH